MSLILKYLARPILAFKRDLSRTSSTTRTSSDQETISPTFITHQESISCSTPLEIIDIEPSIGSGSFRNILDKVKNTLSPSIKRRTSEGYSIDEEKKASRQYRHSSISSLSNKNHRKNRLRHHKSVSFAENTEDDSHRNELVDNIKTLADQIIMASIDETTTNPINSSSTNIEDDEDDFQRNFYQTIRPRRISIGNGNGKDLVYQDISAEIVGYVLKHALRLIEKEDEDLLLTEKQNEDYIDLK